MSSERPLAIFDIDGTLLDSKSSILLAVERVCERHGLPQPSPGMVLGATGLSVAEAVHHLSAGHDAALQQAVIEDYLAIFTDIRKRSATPDPLYPGALETLGALVQAGWQLAIATANTRENTSLILRAHRLYGYFASVQTADDNASKPRPDMLIRAMCDLGTTADLVVMIGDSTFDMTMARAAGVRGVGVAWGYQKAEDLIGAGAVFVAEDFAELRGHLLG